MITALTLGSGAAPAVVLIFGVLAIVLALVQAVLMLFRQAALIILAAVLPLAAAGSVAPATRTWVRKITAWMLALICYKPAAAAVYAAAFTMIGSGRGIRAALTGFVMLALSVLALPVLMKFFTWTTGTVASAGGGGQFLGSAAMGAVAVGALRSQGTATAAQDQAAYLTTRLGPGPDGNPPPGGPAPARSTRRPARPWPGRRRRATPGSSRTTGQRHDCFFRQNEQRPGRCRPARHCRRGPAHAHHRARQRRHQRGRRRSRRPGRSSRRRGSAGRPPRDPGRSRRDGTRRRPVTQNPVPVRTYGGWRRSRSIGLLGLGPAATWVLLGCLIVLLVIAAASPRALLYAGPPPLLAGAAGLIRADGTPLAQVMVQRLRWRCAVRRGRTAYRAEVVLCHAGVLQLPGTLAATELLSAEDGTGGRYGLVRDRHTGYLTATLQVVPVSTWLAEPGDADQWVANWAAWLAGLGYLPTLRWITVTVDTAPDPGLTLAGQVAATLDTSAPRGAVEILDQVVAAAPDAAADVRTWVSVTVNPSAAPVPPRSLAEAITGTGQLLAGLQTALPSCGVSVLGRAQAGDIAGMVRTAFDPAVRGPVGKLLATGLSPALEEQLNWASVGPAGAEECWDCYRHDSGVSVTWAWREAPRQNVTADVLARLLAPGRYPKRVSLQYRPLPAHAAARVLDGEVRAAEFRHEYSRRTRRDVSARDVHDHARARQAADEEARGAGVSLLGIYVTVTVTDPAELAAAVADTEAAAESSRIRLQRLYRSQAAGFTATLPCGICLPELARRFRR